MKEIAAVLGRSTRTVVTPKYEKHRRGLESILETDFDVVGVVTDGTALLTAADILKPDLGLAAGALGYVVKFRADDHLVPAVHAALKGDYLSLGTG